MIRSRIFHLTRAVILLTTLATGLLGCSGLNIGSPVPTTSLLCGNGICDAGETWGICALDCPQPEFSGNVITTQISSEGMDIAVMIATPPSARYPEGAGVVVAVSPFFSSTAGFITDPDLTSLGLIQISYLWPGSQDVATGMASSGSFDYGGEQSIRILRDVIRFSSGLTTDIRGLYLPAISPQVPLTGEVGLYAFADAGIAAVNVLRLYGDSLPGVQYLVGRENPTVDTLSCLEAGYVDDIGGSVLNPFYTYPASYNPKTISIPYSNIRWEADYLDPHTGAVGRAYLDLDGNGVAGANDFLTSWHVPIMYGKRYYSAALTRALLDNGALTSGNWPVDLATPEEAIRDWEFRQSAGNYASLRTTTPDLKVMLVFSQGDHIQAALDKPHIHQAFQGFRFEAGLWVRLNPDRAYAQSLISSAGMDYPDNPANTQPGDWSTVGLYATPGQASDSRLVPLAAVAEMADRSHFGRWDENLGQVLFIYFPPTEQP